jgi:transcriptional regulator with XRE-family HTH domain/DNA polymerase III delta prime subunit
MKQGRSVRLRQERELRGWSRSYIAEQVEVDLGTVGRWERGERLPHPHYRQKLCDLFGKSAQELGLLPEGVDELDENADELDLSPQSPSMHEPGTTPIARETSTSKTLFLVNRQNRQRMLDKMYSFWIKGVLEQSLYGGNLVALSLTEQRDAVADPWALTFQHEVESGFLTTDMHISQVYDEVDGELLILGDPGSGKTTLLLELTRVLLERANREESHPIPVVFNLTSWAIRRRSLSDWLVEELSVKYQVPRQLAQTWVRAEQILPLLDGLDEVAATARSACVEAINTYRREHGLLPMVVCCRRADYFAQNTRLLLRCAIVVQPLAAQQIEAYLSSGDERFAALRRALQEDLALRELASNPLMLSILAQSYQNKIEMTPTGEDSPSGCDRGAESSSVGAVRADRNRDGEAPPVAGFSPLEVRRREVFATYIRRMLIHRKGQNRYTAKQIQHWLTWLARQLVQQQQTVFYIERMQPDWLPTPQAFKLYCCLLVGILVGVLGGITAMLADDPLYEVIRMQVLALFHSRVTPVECTNMFLLFGTPAEAVASIFTPVIVGLLYGIVFGMVGALITWKGPRLQFGEGRTHLSNFSWHGLTLLLGLGCGSIFMLINLLWEPCSLSHGALSSQVAGGLSYGSAGVLVGGLLGLLTGDLFGTRKAQIQPVEALVWARGVPIRRRVIAALLGGALGVLIGGAMELISEVFLQSSTWQIYLPGSMLIGGLFGLAIGGGVGSFSRHTLEKSSLVKPNEGIRRSLRNGLIIALPIGLAISIFTPLALALWLIPGDLQDGLLWCVPTGSIVALILFLLNGGYAWLQHIILRFILYRHGVIPWNYARFLDEAADRLLLRKVGGGYIFIHRLLLDYFASM